MRSKVKGPSRRWACCVFSQYSLQCDWMCTSGTEQDLLQLFSHAKERDAEATVLSRIHCLRNWRANKVRSNFYISVYIRNLKLSSTLSTAYTRACSLIRVEIKCRRLRQTPSEQNEYKH